MKIFPDTEAYAVSYIQATCGSFMCMLIAEFTGTLESYQFSKNGNAHKTLVGTNQVDAEDFDRSMLAPNKLMCRFLEKDPKDPTLPITLTEHHEVDYDLYFTKYPKGKILYIQIDPYKDRLLMEANFFFKVQVDSLHYMPYWVPMWHEESAKYFNGVESPNDPSITRDMIMRLLRDRAEKHAPTTGYPFIIGDVVEVDNVYTHSFMDILHDKQKTLEMVSRLTNRPIPESAHKVYDDYIKAQKPIWDFLGLD